MSESGPLQDQTRRHPEPRKPLKPRLARAAAYAVAGWLAGYYGVGMLAVLGVRLFARAGSDPSLVFALVAVPASIIGAIIGGVRGFRARRTPT